MLAGGENERQVRVRRIREADPQPGELLRREARSRPAGIGRDPGTLGPRHPADPAAGEAQPAIDPVYEERAVQEPAGGHPALRVTDQPEGPEAAAEAVHDQVDHVPEMLVVGLGDPVPGRLRRGRGGGGDDQGASVGIVMRREVQALPGPERAAAMQVEQECQRPPGVVGDVQVELAAGGLIDDRLMAHSDLLAYPPCRLERDSKIIDGNCAPGEIPPRHRFG
jgi:hypothetical protein